MQAAKDVSITYLSLREGSLQLISATLYRTVEEATFFYSCLSRLAFRKRYKERRKFRDPSRGRYFHQTFHYYS